MNRGRSTRELQILAATCFVDLAGGVGLFFVVVGDLACPGFTVDIAGEILGAVGIVVAGRTDAAAFFGSTGHACTDCQQEGRGEYESVYQHAREPTAKLLGSSEDRSCLWRVVAVVPVGGR